MGKKITLGTSITLIIIAIAVTFTLTTVFALRNFNTKVSSITERENMYAKFTEIDEYVRQNHSGSIDETELMDAVAGGYLSGIDDPYAKYMNAEAYSAYLSSSGQSVAGIGVTVSMDSNGYMIVNKVYDSSTAYNAGIQTNDLIIRVNDIKLSADTYEEAEALLTGEAGTKVTLVVRRDSEDTEMEITHRVLTPTTVSATAFGQCGYIRVDDFAESTPDQFSKAFESAVNEGFTAIIIDLRGVNTGLVSSAATMLDKLIGAGDLLTVEYNNGSSEVLYSSNSRESSVPMVLLVNESTSGAAEFFAGSLQEYGKAKIVGMNTAGVGSLQKIFKLDDGSAIQLTIGKYFLAGSGLSWEGVGIHPDHVLTLSYTPDFSDISLLDTTLDTQLAKAIEVVSSGIASTETTSGTQSSSEG